MGDSRCEPMRLRDVVAAIGSSTDSNMNRMRFDGLIDYAPVADFGLLRTSVEVAERRGIVMRVPLEGGGRLVVELSPSEANELGEALTAVAG